MQGQEFKRLLAAVRSIAMEVAAPHADDVDARARFPAETVAALRAAKILSAAVPEEFGGYGCNAGQLAALCGALGQGCSASGMVLAMHLIEVACLARHGRGSDWFRRELESMVAEQTLVGSVTSEVGTSGETRASICAVQREGDVFTLEKAATTVSYGAHADALLVTARRNVDAASGDQVLVYLKRGDYTLTPTSKWETLGMRGTCSPGGQLVVRAKVEQILPGGFDESSAQTMVPYSHILWSALWWGIAAAATGRAAAFVRAQARRDPGSAPPAAPALARATGDLHVLQQLWTASAAAFDALPDDADGREQLSTMGWALRMNHLKIQASEAAPRIVHQALQVIGVMGYRTDSPFSVGRQYRDSLSAALMISNERLASKSAAMLLMVKDV